MKEKISTINRSLSGGGYFKPVGKEEKRKAHKALRRISNDNFATRSKGIQNKVGVHFEWGD